MRLSYKLALAFVAALLPMAGVLGWARAALEQQYRSGFARALDDAVSDAESTFNRQVAEVAAATRHLAHVDDPLVGPLLIELGKGELDEPASLELSHRTAEEMQALGLDVLTLVDAHGEVLAAGHFPGRAGEHADGASAQRAPSLHMQLATERVVQSGAVRVILAVEAIQSVEAHFADGIAPRVRVAAGRELGLTFLQSLRQRAQLFLPDGRVLSTLTGSSAEAHYPRRELWLATGEGQKVRLELRVPDDALTAALAALGRVALIAGSGALMLALLLGWGVSRLITRPVGELAAVVRAVGKGQLDVTAPVRSRDEVGQLAASFNTMTHELGQARVELRRAERIAAWRDIAQRIAHEIKNPLTPIQVAIETLQRARVRAPEKFAGLFDESAPTVIAEVGRLKNIVVEFSRFARLPQPVMAPVDLDALINGALAVHGGTPPPTVTFTPHDLPLMVDGDHDQLVQVLVNLIGNARDAVAGRADGKIELVTRAAPGSADADEKHFAVLEVQDNGVGMSDAVKAHAFEPYVTTKVHGTGLGLAIVERIISDHGGTITIESEPGRGALVRIRLPRRATARVT